MQPHLLLTIVLMSLLLACRTTLADDDDDDDHCLLVIKSMCIWRGASVPATNAAAQIGARMITSLNRTAEKAHTYAEIDGSSYPVTKPTQTIDGEIYVVDPLNRYRQPYDHLSGCSSLSHHGRAEKKHLGGLHVPNLIKHTHTPSPGEVDHCMCNYMRPTNIIASESLWFADERMFRNVAYERELTSAHWGLSADPTNTDDAFTPCTRCSSEHLSERDLDHHHHQPVKKGLDGPSCWDIHSCHRSCSKPQVVHGIFSNWKWFTLALAIPLPLLLLACCLGGCLLRLHRHGGRARAREELRQVRNLPTTGTRLRALGMALLGRSAANSTAQPGDTTTAAPAAATENTIAGPAAGTAAASEKAADPGAAASNAAITGSTTATEGAEGRGTLTRRAEEGRGQVTFAQPPEQTATTTTTAAPAQTAAEHTEPVPVHDGAADGAGTALDVSGMGMGSVRGRRMGRPGF